MEGGRFCFEGGTRCGKGEGLHVFRVDNPEDLQISFDLASKGKLENKKRAASTGFASKFSRINVFSELSWSKKVLGKQRSPAPISEYSPLNECNVCARYIFNRIFRQFFAELS